MYPLLGQALSDTIATSELSVGGLFLGKYRIERVLGAGGMGVVFAATHLELEDRVAIKLLRAEMGREGELVTRFLREARAAAKLRSENVVRVYDVGRTPAGEPYMVMELLDGQDLSVGPLGASLPVADAADYVIQACDAIAAAHDLGMVHRDLKPANLFLTTDGHGVPTVKVLDFGISKLQGQGPIDGNLTHANALMGSPLYMAPEQVRSARDVDARADIWSLGTILFELVTGRPPFQGETLGAILSAVAVDEPPPASALREGVPVELDALIARCLAKAPDARFQSARELQAALLPFGSLRSQAKMALRGSVVPPALQSLPPSVPPLGIGGDTTTSWADTAAARPAVAPPPPAAAALRLPPGLVALAAALALAAIVGVAWLGGRAGGDGASRPTPEPAMQPSASGRGAAGVSVAAASAPPPSVTLVAPAAAATSATAPARRPVSSRPASTAARPVPPPAVASVASPPAAAPPAGGNPLDIDFK